MKRLVAVVITGVAAASLGTSAIGVVTETELTGLSKTGRQFQSLSIAQIDKAQIARQGGRNHKEDEDEYHQPRSSSQVSSPQSAVYDPDDPRDGGLEVVLGEWAVTLEVEVIRPGPVTFVIRNKGVKRHGFRVRSASERGRERFEKRSELLPPGGETTLSVNLVPGTYRVDCYIDEPGVGSHSDMGMQATLSVLEGAPLVPKKAAAPASSLSVSIESFSFSPAVITVPAGSTVVWKNNDPAPHTITADDKSFDSGVIQPGAEFKITFDSAGSFSYKCTIHPSMIGKVIVQGK